MITLQPKEHTMKNYFFLFLVSFSLFLIGSCKDDPESEETSSIELNFKGAFGDDLLLMFQEYSYPDGKKMQLKEFNFFISEVSLIGADDVNTKLVEVDLIDLGFDMNNPALAEQGQTLVIRDVPVGEYTGISIGYGVSADLNRTDPSEYGTDHPLRNNHWSGWSSYIFSVIEGAADMNNDGEIVSGGAESESFSYHSGTNDNYVTGVINQTILVKSESIQTLNFTVDVQKLFRNNTQEFDTNSDGYLDIENYPGTHSDTKQEMFNRIMSNFTAAVSL